MRIKVGYIILCSILLIGCANPFAKFLKTTNKIDKTEQKIQVSQDKQIDLSKGYVYGANLALNKETNRTANVELATDLTRNSLIITGLPKAQDALDFQKIVDGKLSTNKLDNKYADELLQLKNKQILFLEKDVAKLQEKLDKQEEQFKAEAAQNAKDAQLMATIKRWLRFGFFGIVIMVAIRIASLFIPALAPIGFLLDSTVGGLFKLSSKVLPKAVDAAGVVAKESYQVSEKTLSALVDAIQQARQKPEVKTHLDEILKDVTDKEVTRPKILDIKKDLGYI